MNFEYYTKREGGEREEKRKVKIKNWFQVYKNILKFYHMLKRVMKISFIPLLLQVFKLYNFIQDRK